jgi:hypothetical protein
VLGFGFVGAQHSVYCYVIHIDGYISFVYQISKDGVHHGLEGGWGVGQAKEHYVWFEQSLICDKCRLPLVLFLDRDFVVPPQDIQCCELCATPESVGEL